MDILLMVNHEDRSIPYNGKMVVIKSGQKLTSINKLAERWGWSKHRVYRYLALLKEDNMCNVDSTTGGTIITVVNWEFYQSKRNTNGTTSDTTNGTTNGTTGGTQTTINNNYKQRNNARTRASERDQMFQDFLRLVEENEKNDSEGVRCNPEDPEQQIQTM